MFLPAIQLHFFLQYFGLLPYIPCSSTHKSLLQHNCFNDCEKGLRNELSSSTKVEKMNKNLLVEKPYLSLTNLIINKEMSNPNLITLF